MAAPMPWMTRKTIKAVILEARPQSSDAMLNSATPARYTTRCPHRSPSRPIPMGSTPIISTYPETVQDTVPSGARKSCAIVGSATLTIKRSM